MILMPPGSAKSTYASVLFPPWWFTQHPHSSVITASHSHGLAEYFSRRVRALIDERRNVLGFGVSQDHRAAGSWITTSGGEYHSVGVRGAITGRRADLVIIDDPVKSQAEAESGRHREHIWEWYKSDVTTRLKPGGKVVLIMTRWHPEDLGGQLLNQFATEWRVARLPALAERDDPLERPVGTPLWPEWESADALARKRDLIGERAWSALFQQNPLPSGGRLFSSRSNCGVSADAAPRRLLCEAWDLAATSNTGKNDPDWTVGVKLTRRVNGRYVILDVVRIRGTPRQVEDLIVTTAKWDGNRVTISIPEDPGQAGKKSNFVSSSAACRVSRDHITRNRLEGNTGYATCFSGGGRKHRDGSCRVEPSLPRRNGTFPMGAKRRSGRRTGTCVYDIDDTPAADWLDSSIAPRPLTTFCC